MSCWKSNVMWTPPTSDNPYVRRSHKKSTDEIIDDGILWTGQDHSNSISSQNLFTWRHMGIIYGKHMDIPLKEIEHLPINLLILWGRILEFGSISQQLAHMDYPPTTRLRKATSNRHLWCVPSPQISSRIFGRMYSWCYLCTWYLVCIFKYICIYNHICISILAYILRACSNSPTMKLGILPFTNCKLRAVGDYLFISYLFGMCHRLTSTESLCRLATQHIQMVLHLCTSSLLP